MLATLALHAVLIAAAPDLPVFSDATFDEAVARGWPSMSMVLVVGNEQYTQTDWQRSDWADPDATKYFQSKHVRVVYADVDEHRAACWLLDLDRLPAAIVFTGGEERGRRYGLTSGEAKKLVEWHELLRSGSSPAAKLRERIAAEPDNAQLRGELINELNQAGDELGVHTEIAWFLTHPDRFDDVSERPASEAEVRGGLLWFVGGLRERLNLWGAEPTQDGAESRVGSSPRTWSEVEGLAALPDAEQESLRLTQGLARLALEVRGVLQARVDAGTATDRDRFVLEALAASPERFQAMLSQESERQKAEPPPP